MKKPGIAVRLFAVLLLLTAGTLAACSEYSVRPDDGFYAGKEVSPAEIESIAEAVRASVTDKYERETTPEGEELFFWTPGGSVIHRSRNCPSLSKSTEVHCGTKEEASVEGKDRVCSVCGANNK